MSASRNCVANDPRRLEWAQAHGLRTFIATARRLRVATPHGLLEVAGGVVSFFAKGSPLNVARGVAVREPIDEKAFALIEDFFKRCGERFCIETTPATHPTLRALLAARGARPDVRTRIYAMDLRPNVVADSVAATDPTLRVAAVGAALSPTFADVVGRGFNEGKAQAEMFRDFGPINLAITRGANYLATLDGTPAAGGRVTWMDVPRDRGGGRVALLTGASTLPEFRRRGAQSALLAVRVAHARSVGCDTAFMGCRPDTASERNIARAGFSRAYERDLFVID